MQYNNDNRSTEIFNNKKTNTTKHTILDWGEKNGNSFTRFQSKKTEQVEERQFSCMNWLTKSNNLYACCCSFIITLFSLFRRCDHQFQLIAMVVISWLYFSDVIECSTFECMRACVVFRSVYAHHVCACACNR